MNMTIHLSPRLEAVAQAVPPGACVIDVGTDHARLPVWLVQSGRVGRVIAADLRPGPLEGAATLINKTGTADRITLRLTNGLSGLGPRDGDTIVIAGMGGETMISILSAAPWTRQGTLLILEPQSKQAELRKFLIENGYSVTSERLVKDAGRLYPILTVRGGAAPGYSLAELHTGLYEQISDDPLFGEYLSGLADRMAHAAPYDSTAAEISNELQEMKRRYVPMTTVQEVFTLLAQKAPVEGKLDFDNVGLLVGRGSREVHQVLTALDIVDEVIEEAAAIGAELIVSHHPLFFDLKSVTDSTWTGSRALTLAENHIAAICMHTNLDAAEGGVNDALMAALGGHVTGQLDPVSRIGRIGEMAEELPFSRFLPMVKSALSSNGLRYHDAGRPVKRLAVCGGSGGGEIALACQAGCDTYVTADVKYDQFLEARHLGVNLIDADHFCTENVVVPVLAGWLREAFPELDVHIAKSHGQTAQFY
ncbi:MAG: Nif3-like dinuclear metal center hexameric protein [Oscillospiraceae bacterium]|nr:Nif3-like dinuclear metal center hexameric protein [Oscillospiraceae bacterium]